MKDEIRKENLIRRGSKMDIFAHMLKDKMKSAVEDAERPSVRFNMSRTAAIKMSTLDRAVEKDMKAENKIFMGLT